jgi:hypothetical protein
MEQMIGYVRQAEPTDDLDRQVAALRKAGCINVFADRGPAAAG